MTRCTTWFAAPSMRLTFWLLNTVISRRMATELLPKGKRAMLTYCCQR
jgi:hypothetical protein